jgi:CheY-like chemotaxis protein
VSNAVKFTERGSVMLRVLRSPTAHKSHLRFEVIDTGVGIKPQVQQTLFQPFVQADSSTTRRYGGTGLGLAISKRIVTLMGGEIGVTSIPGHGSTFWFTAHLEPVAGLSGEAEPDASSGEPVIAGPLAQHARPILVAEDNPVNQKVVSLMLRNLGYAFRVVATGREVIEALRQAPYALVLMDEHMPEMDGVTATREIRQACAAGMLPFNPTIPIVATTADAMPGTRERCLDAGMDDYLAKPIRADALANAIRVFTGQAQAEMARAC